MPLRDLKIDFGAVGDGVADDTAELQAAVNSGEEIFVPIGRYKIMAPIDYSTTGSLRLFGAGGRDMTPMSEIVQGATFTNDAPMFHRGLWVDRNDVLRGSGVGSFYGTVVLEDLVLKSFGAGVSVGQFYNPPAPSHINRCTIYSDYRGILVSQGFQFSIENCDFISYYMPNYPDLGQNVPLSDPRWQYANYSKAWGLAVTSGVTVESCSFRAWGCGIHAVAAGTSLSDLRIEVNGVGMILGGKNYQFDTYTSSPEWDFEGFVKNCTWESNKRGVVINKGRCWLEHLGTYAFEGAAPWFLADFGVADYSNQAQLFDVSANGHYDQAGIIISGGGGHYEDVRAFNAKAGRATILGVDAVLTGGVSIRSPFNVSKNAGLSEDRRTVTHFRDLQLRGLKAVDQLNTNVLPNNLGGTVTMPAGATTVAVAFPGAVSEGAASFSSAPAAAAHAGSTLPAGTYEYAATYRTAVGETGVSIPGVAYGQVTIAANQRAQMTTWGVSGQTGVHRIYRRKLGNTNWDGFFEFAGGVFQDTGQAFTGFDNPPASGALVPSSAELDANYRIVATPAWTCTVRAFSKTTTGFTLGTNNPGPTGGGAIDWLLFRS